jgi:hypothetical protein
MRRTPLLVVALLALCLGLVTFAPARGQQPVPTEETRIFPFSIVPSNGYASITEFGGFSTGLLDVSCGGNLPLGGSVVPLAVITALRSTSIQVRVVSWAPGGHLAVVNGTRVLVNCAIDAPTSFWEGPGVAAKAAQLRQQAHQ